MGGCSFLPCSTLLLIDFTSGSIAPCVCGPVADDDDGWEGPSKDVQGLVAFSRFYDKDGVRNINSSSHVFSHQLYFSKVFIPCMIIFQRLLWENRRRGCGGPGPARLGFAHPLCHGFGWVPLGHYVCNSVIHLITLFSTTVILIWLGHCLILVIPPGDLPQGFQYQRQPWQKS